MSNPKSNSTKLPPEADDHIVDVKIQHLIIGFSVFMISAGLITGSVILLKDHLRTRRQQLFVDSLHGIISTIQNSNEKGK
jgi:hypothetical protein